jgi:NTE family protein
MGALVGATFATGRTPDDIENAVIGIDWSQTVGGQGRRDRMPINRKLDSVNHLNSLEFGLSKGKFRAPAGFIQTQDIEGVIWNLVSSAQTIQDFDDLPIPFRAVATDMVAGEMVVLDGGDLAVAMRASMAIPGAFAPVRIDDKVLADGGLMRNLPVDVVRELCADVVIAVWMTNPIPEPDDVVSAFELSGRSLLVMVEANERIQIQSLGDSDVGIEVRMGDIGTVDFLRIADAIELGKSAAEASREALLQHAVSEQEYLAWQESTGRMPEAAYHFSEVRIDGNDRVNTEYINSSIKMADLLDAPVNTHDIAVNAERIYALGDFERVSYRIIGTAEQQVLEFNTVEKSWGPNFFRFDYGLASHGDSDLKAIIRADHERTWVNSRGGRWHNALQFGQQSLLTTNFYQPIDAKQRYFVEPIASFEQDREDFYLDGDRAAQYFIRQLYAEVHIGMNLGNRAQVRLGLRHGWEEAQLDTGTSDLPELDRRAVTSLQLRAVYDTRNSTSLPTRGTLIHARYVQSEKWFGSDLTYKLLEGAITKSFSINDNALTLLAGGGSTLSGDLPITQQIQLGGIRTFPGLRPGELRGDEYWFAASKYFWQISDSKSLFGHELYAGLRLQAGEVGRFDDIDDGTLLGISASIGGNTPIGAFAVSLGYVDNGSFRIQFSLGRPVDEGSLLDALH